ncbi:MAG: alpha/beta fold hydrolase [Odoribacteraceae bacterium]|nr:alpha/beta fold hydrolase [Odoribacteraceae bacterium]
MKLFYREKGQGPPLVILHGLWGASENWLPVANRLADAYRVILPDLRNHGRSPRAAAMDLETMAGDVDELVASLSLPARPALLGHSLGGKVAMTLWLERPGAFSRLVVADVAPVRYPPLYAAGHERLLAVMEQLDLARFPTLSVLSAALVARLPLERERQLVLKNVRRDGRGLAWKVNLPAIRANLDRLLDFPRHLPPVPPGDRVLFVRGERSDHLVPGDSSFLSFFPGARLVQVDDCGHWLHAEQPGQLARVIRDFLA